MKKYVFTEIEPEATEFEFEFDGDTFKETSGDYCNTLFIITSDGYGRYSGFNYDEYKKQLDEMNCLIDEFIQVSEQSGCYEGATYKEIMQSYNVPFNPTKCHKLKLLAEEKAGSDISKLCDYLTIKTGKQWEITSVNGYCQGDYAEILYCPKNNSKEIAKREGELWLGCGKEFSLSTYYEDEEEPETVYGYFIANCEYITDKELKNKLCEYEGIEPENCTLKLITNTYTRTITEYEEI